MIFSYNFYFLNMGFDADLQKLLGKHSCNQVDKLLLDNLFNNIPNLTLEHKRVLEKYKDLKHLSLNCFGLEKLNNLPYLPSLMILELRENLIDGNDFNLIVESFPNIHKLKLGSNLIENIDSFDAFKNTNLVVLDLEETPISHVKDYKKILFKKLPSLKSIDNKNREGKVVSSNYSNEEEEDADFEASDDGEDEFDEDFDDDEEELVLSNYDSETGEKKDLKIKSNLTKINKN